MKRKEKKAATNYGDRNPTATLGPIDAPFNSLGACLLHYIIPRRFAFVTADVTVCVCEIC